jgi:hypothetical protein
VGPRQRVVGLLVACGACAGSGGHGASPPPVIKPGPLDGTWTAISADGAPAGQGSRVAVWSGSALFIWGGVGSCLPLGLCDGGAEYDPAADHWTVIGSSGAPGGRDEQASAWIGNALFVWGGRGCGA